VLRRCRKCGLEAIHKNDLNLFVIRRGRPYNRDTICKECFNSMKRAGGKYNSTEKRLKKKWNPIHTKRYGQRMYTFKDKVIRCDYVIRKNVCSECGKKYPEELDRQTVIHHDKYDKNNPLAHTRELCFSCHIKYHYKNGDIKGGRKKGFKHSEATKKKISESHKSVVTIMTKQQLKKLYVDNELTLTQIANKYNVVPSVVYQRMKALQIPRRKRGRKKL